MGNFFGYFEKPHSYVSTAAASFWPYLENFGLLLNLVSGHSDLLVCSNVNVTNLSIISMVPSVAAKKVFTILLPGVDEHPDDDPVKLQQTCQELSSFLRQQ